MSNRSGYRCAFKDCTSVSGKSDGSKKTLFGFPKNAERYVFYYILYFLRSTKICFIKKVMNYYKTKYI